MTLETASEPPLANRAQASIWLAMSGLVILALAGGLALWADRQLRQAGDAVQHTLLVKQGAMRFLSHVQDAEIGQRGYLLTGREQYLEPYNVAVLRINEDLAALAALIADNWDQTQRVQALQVRLSDKLQELDSTIALYRAGEIEQAIELVLSDDGMEQMDGIRRVVNTMQQAEDRLLEDRQSSLGFWNAIATGAIIFCLLVVVVLAGLIARSAARDARAAEENRAVLRGLNEKLEDRVRRHTQDAEDARRLAEAETARAEFERGRVETLIQDMNHRVGNNLAMVAALLGMQITGSESPAVKESLKTARNRIMAIAVSQRRLRLNDDLATTRADDLFREVVRDIHTVALGDSEVVLRDEFTPIVMDSRDAVTLSIILNELIVNCLKHAFPDKRAGEVRVSFGPVDGEPRMDIIDNGVGFSYGGGPSAGLGTSIVEKLARQYRGTVEIVSQPGQGTHTTVRFPGLTLH
jgi:two-component sensor histidine kinase/CHASE3 domain sensor protein